MRLILLLGATIAFSLGCDGEDPLVEDAGTDAGPTVEDGGPPTGDAGRPTADTWSSFAEGFFATYCTECHAGGTRDYRTIDEVRRDADSIACGVSPTMLDGCGSFPAPRQFPVGSGPFPSDAERERLIAWIAADLPE